MQHLNSRLLATLILITCFINVSIAQKSAAKWALKKGRIGEFGLYRAELPNEVVTMDKLGKWAQKEEYAIIRPDIRKRWVGGQDRLVVISFNFLPRSEFSPELQAQLKRQEEEGRILRERLNRERIREKKLAEDIVWGGSFIFGIKYGPDILNFILKNTSFFGQGYSNLMDQSDAMDELMFREIGKVR